MSALAEAVVQTEIPIVDIGPYLAGEPGALERAAQVVGPASETLGFFYVRNHGVPAAVIEATVAEAQAFFRQPIARKREAAVNARHRGFNALGDALMYEAKHPDYKEFFWFNDALWINRVFKVFFLDVFVLVFSYELLALLKFVIF